MGTPSESPSNSSTSQYIILKCTADNKYSESFNTFADSLAGESGNIADTEDTITTS